MLRRRLHQVVMALFIGGIFGCLAMVGGAVINDRTIESDRGRSLATVTDTGWLRTTVDYRDEEGIYHSPQTGLLYPTGLGEGQQVWVNYARSEPELVKVEGREWTLSIIPALSVGALATIIAGLLWMAVGLIGRRSRNADLGGPVSK